MLIFQDLLDQPLPGDTADLESWTSITERHRGCYGLLVCYSARPKLGNVQDYSIYLYIMTVMDKGLTATMSNKRGRKERIKKKLKTSHDSITQRCILKILNTKILCVWITAYLTFLLTLIY